MKRYGLFILLGLTICGGVQAQSLVGRTMYVAVKSVELRSATGVFSEILGVLEYGEQVTVLKENGRWVEIRWAQRASITGWMTSASLTTKRITVAGRQGGGGTSASANELALAGKGFSEEVERSYRAETALDFSLIDAMEEESVAHEELFEFLTEGHLFLGDR